MTALALIIALVAAAKHAAAVASLTRRWLVRREAEQALRRARGNLLRWCLVHPVRVVA